MRLKRGEQVQLKQWIFFNPGQFSKEPPNFLLLAVSAIVLNPEPCTPLTWCLLGTTKRRLQCHLRSWKSTGALTANVRATITRSSSTTCSPISSSAKLRDRTWPKFERELQNSFIFAFLFSTRAGRRYENVFYSRFWNTVSQSHSQLGENLQFWCD